MYLIPYDTYDYFSFSFFSSLALDNTQHCDIQMKKLNAYLQRLMPTFPKGLANVGLVI